MPQVSKYVRTLNKLQQLALKRIYDRGPIYTNSHIPLPITYRQFRRNIHFHFDCVLISWRGMWLGIEEDGYTH